MIRLKNILYVVVPCYNEEAVLPKTAEQLRIKLAELREAGNISEKSRVLFIDDGSRDATWELIEKLHESDEIFEGVKLSRNRGHQYALLAGLMTARHNADFTVSIDADMQDDVNAVNRMVDKYLSGCEIVYGIRSARKTDGFFKRVTAEGYYKLLQTMGCDIVFNHADYRLMSSRVLTELAGYREQGLFLRGIVPMLGYKTAEVEYERLERSAGESKYPLRRMLALAFDGIAALSLSPLRFVTGLGIIAAVPSAIYLIYAFVAACLGQPLNSWKLIMASVWCVGGLILLALGVLGEYIGRTYLEVKHRPRFIIEKTTGISPASDFERGIE